VLYTRIYLAFSVKENNVMKYVQRLISRDWQPGHAALAGFIATIAYSIAMEGDILLAGNRFSDVLFIEGLLAGGKRSKPLYFLSWAIHFLNGVALGELYGAVFKRYLPGPNWLKGTIFGEIFIVSMWWLTPLADKYHPFIKDVEMPRLFQWKSFFQNIVRHLVFGLALGLLYKDK